MATLTSYLTPGPFQPGTSADRRTTYRAPGPLQPQLPISFTASGGLTLGGTATASLAYSVTASGGLTLGGSATADTVFNVTGSDGLTLGGTATASSGFSVTGSGGLTLSGSGSSSAAYRITGSGGLNLGGTEANSRFSYQASALGTRSNGDISIPWANLGTIAAGDLLVLITFESGIHSNDLTGWSQLVGTSGSPDEYLRAYWRVATGTESGNFTHNLNLVQGFSLLLRYSAPGTFTADASGYNGLANGNGSQTQTLPTLTTTADNDLVLSVSALGWFGTTLPSAVNQGTVRFQAQPTLAGSPLETGSVAVADFTQPRAGSTGAVTWSYPTVVGDYDQENNNNGSSWLGLIFSFKPAAAPRFVTTGSGGLSVGGTANAALTYVRSGSGGLNLGGSSSGLTFYNFSGSGGSTLGGAATVSTTFSPISSGLLSLTGTAYASVDFSYRSTGGLILSGNSAAAVFSVVTGSGAAAALGTLSIFIAVRGTGTAAGLTTATTVTTVQGSGTGAAQGKAAVFCATPVLVIEQQAPVYALAQHSYTPEAGLTTAFSLPGSALQVRLDKGLIGHWAITATTTPTAELVEIVNQLDALGADTWQQLFGVNPVKPYASWAALWRSNQPLPYRLGAVLLAVAARTDALRNGGL